MLTLPLQSLSTIAKLTLLRRYKAFLHVILRLILFLLTNRTMLLPPGDNSSAKATLSQEVLQVDFCYLLLLIKPSYI